MHIKTKAARFWQLAFSIIILSTFIGCQDPGTLGGGFIDKTDIDVDTLLITNLNVINQDAYLGRLGRSATGRYDDDLFGSIESVSFFKPSIFRSADTVVFDANTVFKLQLSLQEGEIYGDTTQTGNYSIYRVSSLWRGSAFRNSMSINYDEAEVIGQFTDADIDTNGVVEVELIGSWKDDYISFFNEPDDTRDNLYKQNDFGLAVVPDAANGKVIYANYLLSTIEALAEDTTSHFILDWGYDLERTGITTEPERLRLQTTFNNILKLDLSSFADEISDINFVRAELVFNRDTLQLQSTLEQNEVRSPSLGLGMSLGPLDDVAYEIAFGTIDLSAAARDDGTYRFNITNILNNYLHGEFSIDDLYLYLSANQGTLAYTSLYNVGTDPELAPRVILYGLESGVR